MKSPEDQILNLQLEVANLKRTVGYLKKLEKQLQAKQAGLAKLDHQVENKYRDILALKKKGLIDLFVDQQEEKKELAEQKKLDYHDAIVQLKDAEKAIKIMEFEIEILREKAVKLPEKELLLQQLKIKKTLPDEIVPKKEIPSKKESDKEILIKNRFKIAAHKLITSGRKIQVYLEDIENALNQIETWQNYQLSEIEKERIFREELAKIEKVLNEQKQEMRKFSFELKKLSEFEKIIAIKKRADLEKVMTECTSLKGKLALFVETILNNLSTNPNLLNELTKLKAKIVEIQYSINQTTKLLQL